MQPVTDEDHARLAIAKHVSEHLNAVIAAYAQEWGLSFFCILAAATRVVSEMTADVPRSDHGIFACRPEDIDECPG
jgi:hypothetical protein